MDNVGVYVRPCPDTKANFKAEYERQKRVMMDND